MRTKLIISAAAGVLAALCATAALAQGGLDSSGEVVEVPVGVLTGPLPAADITGAPRAEPPLTSLDPVSGEHPVYHLRPEPFSEAGTLLVTLDDLLALALEHNLGLRGEQTLVERGHYAVDQTYYQFDPSLGAALNYSRRNIGGTRAQQQGGVTSSEGLTASFDYTMPMEYGDSLTFGYNVDRSRFSINDTGGEFESPTTFGSGFTLGYTRPLLQGGGRFLHRIPRFVASNNLALAYERLGDRGRTLKGDVLDAYFLSVAAREAIDVRTAGLERALLQLERAVERYKVGLGIQADVLQAENSVLNQRATLLTAQHDYLALVDSLTQLVGLPLEFELAIDADGALLGLSSGDPAAELPPDLWTLVETNSFDLKSLNTQLANLRLNREQLLDRLQPQLDLDLSYGRTGEDEGLGAAIGGLENDSYQVGLSFRQTPGNRTAKADVAMNELDLASAELQIQDVELQLKTRLRELQRNLVELAQQVQLAQSNVVVTRETLNIVQERANVGLVTTLDVIEAQEDLLAAELALLRARVAYQQAYREVLVLAGLI